jgi:DNA-binding NarL/FixJ family response regulator
MREGVVRLLESDGDVHVAATCTDLDSLLPAVEEHEPDVLVTDIRMPPTNTDEGIRAAGLLRRTRPELGVVVLSQYDEPEYAVELLAAGAAGRAYLLKDTLGDAAGLLHAVREVAAGRSVIDPQVVEGLVTARNRFDSSPLRLLTPRELDVLSAMAQGRSNDAIAGHLFISVRVVEKHISSIFAKLGLTEEAEVHRRVKAVLIYLSSGATP